MSGLYFSEVAEIFAIVLLFACIAGAVYWARSKFPALVCHWTNGVIPAIVGGILLHYALWWWWTEFWVREFRVSGFILLQFILMFGFYLLNLKFRPTKTIGVMIAIVGMVGLSVNTYNVFTDMKILSSASKPAPGDPTTGKPGERIYIAGVAPEWGEIIPTPGQTWYNSSGPAKMRINAGEQDERIIDVNHDDGGRPGGGVHNISFQTTSAPATKIAVAK